MTEATATKSTMATRLEALPSFEDFQQTTEGWSMAKKIRYLASLQEKEDRGAIAKYLGIRYQWVRNVLIAPVKEA